MKRLLIISPYFPPANTADMQRVRMSLPYFAENGWDAEVIAVDPQYVDLAKDNLLMESIPAEIKIHSIKAFPKRITSQLGFGSIAYRCMLQVHQKAVKLLQQGKFDLVYFSTTQFQVCILGRIWKKRFGIPYVIDMQDPWHSEYYRDKPKSQQPPKYRFSYQLNKFLEPLAMKAVSGLISVSPDYIDVLKARYPQMASIPSAVITFGAFEPDAEIAAKHQHDFQRLLDASAKNIVYIGRGGMDMHSAIQPVFEAVKQALVTDDSFRELRFYFIGTSYMPEAESKPTILPLAERFGLEKQVTEITGRIGYYHALATLQQADALFIPGSDDPQYTASKIYPYLLSGKPLLAVFNAGSSAIGILKEFGPTGVYSYNGTPQLTCSIQSFLKSVVAGDIARPVYNAAAIEKYAARTMARRQCGLFNSVISAKR